MSATGNIEGRVVVITGASSGLGESTARLLVEKGARVVLGTPCQERIDRVVADIKRVGDTAFGLATEVTKQSDVEMLVDGAVRNFGRVAVHAISEGLRVELHSDNIRVTTIAPGAFSLNLKAGTSDEASARSLEELYKIAIPAESVARTSPTRSSSRMM